MKRRLVVLLALVLVAGCGGGGGGNSSAAATTTSSTTTTIAPTTTEEPTTTNAKADEAAREGCKELAKAKDDDGIRRGIIFFTLSANDDFSGPANEFVNADKGGDQRTAFGALTDLNIACHKAGLL